MLAHLNDAITACNQALWNGAEVKGVCQTMGNILQSLGRFEEAMSWHAWALDTQPNRADLFACLGKLYAQQQRWTEAIAVYQQALSLCPQHAQTYWSLATIYAHLNQSAEELDCRYQALRLKPEWATPQNQFRLGNLLMEQHRFEQAITCYQRAIELQPDFLAAHYNLAVSLAQRHRWQEAIAAYQHTLTLDPAHSASHFGLGKALAHQGNEQGAVAHYRQAIDLQPDFTSALYALGELLLQQGEWAEGAALYRRAIALQPDFSWSYHYLGYALLKQGKYIDASQALQQALALNPDAVWTYHHLARALFQQQRWNEVIAVTIAAIQREPNLTGIYTLLGGALRQQWQREPTLLDRYQQAPPVPMDSDPLRTYLHLGHKLMQHNQFDGAILFYRLALLSAPNHAQLQAKLKQALAQKQQVEQKMATLRQQIEKHPKVPWFYSQLANIMAEQGAVSDAIALNQQANVLQGWHQAAEKHYEFTCDWFTHHIPVWQKTLGFLAHTPDLNVLEIGSFEGRSTCWFLDHILTAPSCRISCIDLYFQDRFELNLDRSGAKAKVKKLQGNSLEILPTLRSNLYDVIYIDGCHLADHVRQDAFLSWPLLKSGGILIFDDYKFHDPDHPDHDPQPAIDQFLVAVQDAIEIVHQDYQVIVRKTA